MQVIIAEKPSVAREIAAIVGATNRKDGFIEGNGYAVTWAFGHLVGLAMPQQYGIAGFRRENLPILPSDVYKRQAVGVVRHNEAHIYRICRSPFPAINKDKTGAVHFPEKML